MERGRYVTETLFAVWLVQTEDVDGESMLVCNLDTKGIFILSNRKFKVSDNLYDGSLDSRLWCTTYSRMHKYKHPGALLWEEGTWPAKPSSFRILKAAYTTRDEKP
jgi:hypothetical protein